MSFNFNELLWKQYSTGQVSSFRFADPDNSSDARTEYRKGLYNTSVGRISLFDQNKDGKLSLNEYINEQSSFLDTASQTLPKAQRTVLDNQRANREFKSLDINSDGFLDYKEIASELSLLDQISGETDGKFDSYAHAKLHGNGNDEIRTNLLRQNYSDMNLDRLGEAGDIPNITTQTDNSVNKPEQEESVTKSNNDSDKFLSVLKKILPMFLIAIILSLFINNKAH